jgi:hypothetical protein
MMKHVGTFLFGSALLAAFAIGCGNNGPSGGQGEDKLGHLALPLVTNGPSGTRYQLRNAIFDITPYYYYWYGPSVGGASSVSGTGINVSGTGGSVGQSTGGSVGQNTGGATPAGTTQPGVIVVSSDDNPDADSIQVDLAEGDYYIHLRPGWYLQSVVNGVAQTEDAVLLNGDYQWVYVYRHSTSWVSFQFGLGSQELWFNGKVNIQMAVYENPDQYYGGSTGGASWAGGATWATVGGSANIGTGGAMNAGGATF